MHYLGAAVSTADVVQRIASNWAGAPPITVVRAAADLPVPAPDDARGLFWRGMVWVVAQANQPADVARTLSHEVLGHYGLRMMLGPAWRGFMDAVQGGVRAGDLDLQDLRQDVRYAYADQALPSHHEADEVCAALAERGINHRSGRYETTNPLKKRVSASLGYVLREHLYADSPVTYDELEGALLAAEHHVRYGGPWYGIGRKLRDWYHRPMAAPNPRYDPPMSLAESERLLQAEEHRLQSKEGWKMVFGFIALIFFIVTGIGCVGYLGFTFFHNVGRMFFG